MRRREKTSISLPVLAFPLTDMNRPEVWHFGIYNIETIGPSCSGERCEGKKGKESGSDCCC